MIRLQAILTLAAAAIAAASATGSPAVSVAPSTTVAVPAGSYVPGELIVRFKPKHRSAALKSAAIGRLGAAVAKDVGDTGFVRVVLESGDDVERAMARYQGDAAVESVQPNFRYRPQRLPDSNPDPFFDRLWALKNNGQVVPQGTYPNNGGSAGNDMGMEAAWDLVTDCTGVVVAVIDTGINYRHRDLVDNMWDGTALGYPNHGKDFFDDDLDPMPADADGHGTHVAGVIAAKGDNGVGTTGVCWRARIMALRALNADGGRTDTVTAAVDFAINHGARIINLSLGGSGHDRLFEAKIEQARERGVVVVVAGGNGGRDTDRAGAFYPCNFTSDNLICVAALDQAYMLAVFSNYGDSSVDVAAPGTNSYSAWPGESKPLALSSWENIGGWQDCGGFLTNTSCPNGQYGHRAEQYLKRYIDDLGAVNLLGAGLTGYYRLQTADGSPPWPYTSPDPDSLTAGAIGLGDDPFANGATTAYIPDSPNGEIAQFALSLQNCMTPSCRAGFRFLSDDAGSHTGAQLYSFTLRRAQADADVYKYADGTSMATAHVSGVAALVWAYNPNYTYADVVNAVKHGGDLLPNLQPTTATGRAVDAMGALRYINPPTGIVATVR